MAQYIYQPRGRAREYCDWALNLYRGCPHQCAYCYCPGILRMERYEFHKVIQLREGLLKGIERELEKMPKGALIHLCFVGDPYPNVTHMSYGQIREVVNAHTARKAIQLIKEAGCNVQILTKGGDHNSVMPDLDLMDEHDWFGVTLTMDNDDDSRLWEPFASTPSQRIDLLTYARSFGVQTWVSLEPVIYPVKSLAILEKAVWQAGVDVVKVGPLNHKGSIPKWLLDTVPQEVDWHHFVGQVETLCSNGGVKVYLKEDMRGLLDELP